MLWERLPCPLVRNVLRGTFASIVGGPRRPQVLSMPWVGDDGAKGNTQAKILLAELEEHQKRPPRPSNPHCRESRAVRVDVNTISQDEEQVNRSLREATRGEIFRESPPIDGGSR